ncbi:hypothetical protein LINPERHAP1_LOCUS20908, partial [Linum perenne]
KSVYFPNTSVLLSNGRGRPSWGWQSLILGRDLLLSGIRWQIGTGVQVDSTQDLWLPGSVPQRPQLRFAGIFLGPSSVAGFISQGRWNVSLLRYWFTDDSVRLIQSIPLPRHPQPDRRVWHHSPSGSYSTSSGYEFAMKSRPDLFSMNLSPMESSIWLSVWSLEIQPKLRFFLWKILHRILPTMHGIKIRIQSETLDSTCPVCLEGPETIEHLLLHCRISQCFLRMCSLHPPNFGDTHISIYWKHLLAFQPQLQQVWVMARWRIWKSRNRVVFEFAQTRLEVLFQQFHSQWREHTQVYGPSSIPLPCQPGPLHIRCDSRLMLMVLSYLAWVERQGGSSATHQGEFFEQWGRRIQVLLILSYWNYLLSEMRVSGAGGLMFCRLTLKEMLSWSPQDSWRVR